MLFDNQLIRYIISHFEEPRPLDLERIFGRKAPVDVEIGFGMGEFLVDCALKNPDRNFIGIELHSERIVKTLKRIKSAGIKDNVRILRVDAAVAFERLIKPEQIDNIYCLFPCPWPKKAHVKHRLFSRRNLKLFNNRLKKGGRLKITTDYFPYFQWIKDEVQTTGLKPETRVVRPGYNTKFERKWLEEGQQEFFEIELLKNSHSRVKVKRDISLKVYHFKKFDWEKFSWEDAKGKVSVILKEKMFDPSAQKGMFHFVVAEENLIQHFWAVLYKSKDMWHIKRAEGQNFFPTEGVALALECLYNAARNSK